MHASMKRGLVACAAALVCLAIPSAAFADGPAPTTSRGDGYVEQQGTDGSQIVEFKGDPLDADILASLGQLIRPRPEAARVTLIRPRTNFVPELLKSTETM